MTAMANVTIKANDGTTDITYTQLCASAGDKIPARWNIAEAAVPSAYRKTAEMSSRFNAARDARRVEVISRRPVTATVNGAVVLIATPMLATTLVAPTSIVQSEIDEIVAQHANLLKSTLIQTCLKEQYAPQ